MQSAVTSRLSVMMFIQFFVWGAWYTTVGQYMARIGLQDSIGWVYTVGPIAAILSPLFLGIVADRFFNSERLLCALMIVGGVTLLFAPTVAESCAANWQATRDAWAASGVDPASRTGQGFLVFDALIPDHLPFIGLIFLHMLCYMPTLGLTNTIAFRNIEIQERQFPVIRVFGTIGWIVAGLFVSLLLAADETPKPLLTAGAASIALGIYSLTLPRTPPVSRGRAVSIKQLLGLDAIGMMREKGYAVFIVCSLLICIPLAGYYAFAQNFVNHAGFKAPAAVMTIGQVSEIFFMLAIPFFFRRLGVKWMLAIGMAAWSARYLLFSLGAPDGVRWMILAGIAFHGICYDFFFVTGFIYTDKKAPSDIRAQAQGFLVLVTQGLGLGIGAQVMQRLVVRPNRSSDSEALSAEASALRDSARDLQDQAAATTGDAAAALRVQADGAWSRASELLLQTYDWRMIWLIPAVLAGAIFVVFVAAFWDRSADDARP